MDSDDPLVDILSSSPSSSSSQTYLSHLTTLSLSDLLAEPITLQTQAHHLTSSLTSLTHTSYPTFLALHSTTNALTSSLDSLSSSLDALLTTSLPALEESAAAWHTRTDTVLHDRSKARIVLEQHDKIKDLFDIPLFIDTCVRNGYFSEALSLANHAASLSLGPEAPLILTSIQAEVRHSIMQMLLSLLATLHEPSRKLPALWKAVNFLRKMDAFGSGKFLHDPSTLVHGDNLNVSADNTVSSEEQLALAFLTGRLTCLAGMLEPISRDINRLISNSVPTVQTPVSTSDSDSETTTIASRTITDRDKEDVARYLKKYIDVWREGVYDIITQYSTIFLEEQPHHRQQSSKSPASHLPSSLPTQSSDPPQPQPQPLPQPPTHLLSLLTSHLLQKHLLPLLHTTLPLLPLTLLTPLLTQLTYCATAFARVGLDFRGLLGGMIESAVLHSVGSEITDVGEKWVVRIKAAMGVSIENKGKARRSSTAMGKRPSEWLIVPSHADSLTEPPSSPSGPAHIPPQMLASYPPLAEHTNALLGVLNSLRLLAPRRIMCELLGVLEEVLGEGGEVLCEYLQGILGADVGLRREPNGDQRKDAGKERERERRIAKMVGEVYFRVFVPFLRRALVEGVYGVKDVDGRSEMNGSGGGSRVNGNSKSTGAERLKEAAGMWEDMCR
jgi:conserved oligomeric Golgi complex subunit 8